MVSFRLFKLNLFVIRVAITIIELDLKVLDLSTIIKAIHKKANLAYLIAKANSITITTMIISSETIKELLSSLVISKFSYFF